FLTGVTGAFFKSLALTLASSLAVSFVIAFFAIPLLADYFMTVKETKTGDHNGPVFRRVLSGYRKAFEALLRSPPLVLPVLAGFLAIGYLAYTNVGSGFMPLMNEGAFVFEYIARPGISPQDDVRMLKQLERLLNQVL